MGKTIAAVELLEKADFSNTQPVLPFLLSNSLTGLSPEARVRPCDDGSDECRARHFFGYWQDSATSIEDAEAEADYCEDTRVDFLMICPRPHWYSLETGRSVMGVSYDGGRYILSFEGVRDGVERVAIGTLPGSDVEQMQDPEFDPRDLVAAAILAATGREISPYGREFSFVSVDGLELFAMGCASFWGGGE